MMTILLINTALAWEVQTTEGGAEYHWADMPLDYVWVPDGAPDLEELQRAIDGAFTTWSEVPSAHISVEPVETDATGEVALDEDHVVFFQPDWPLGNEALAIATTWADEEGRVVSFDIRINGRSPWTTTGDGARFDLRAAVTHEVGHVLGLEHSAVGDATMFAAHDVGEDWRAVLHDDDEEGVQYLYSEASLSSNDKVGLGCAIAPTSTSGGSTGSGPGSAAWLLVGCIPLTLLRRRQRPGSRAC